MLGNVVHPCREDIYSNTVSTVMDVQICIQILYNYKWILEICDGYVAPRLLSRRESRKDLWGCGYNMFVKYKLLFFTLLHAARCLELLEAASLR